MPQFKNWSHQIPENNSNAFLGWWKNLYVRVKFQWGKRKVVKKRCQISTVKEKFQLGEKKICKRRGGIKVVRKMCREKSGLKAACQQEQPAFGFNLGMHSHALNNAKLLPLSLHCHEWTNSTAVSYIYLWQVRTCHVISSSVFQVMFHFVKELHCHAWSCCLLSRVGVAATSLNGLLHAGIPHLWASWSSPAGEERHTTLAGLRGGNERRCKCCTNIMLQ